MTAESRAGRPANALHFQARTGRGGELPRPAAATASDDALVGSVVARLGAAALRLGRADGDAAATTGAVR